MSSLQSYQLIAKQLSDGKIAPVYFLHGDESYFIDKLADYILDKSLTEAERSFNLDVLYGPEVNGASLVANARSYPVMAQRRVMLIKEAHRIRKDQFDKLAQYLADPVETTTMVFLHKSGQKPDRRTKFGKTVFSNATVFESKKLYENQVFDWLGKLLTQRKVSADPDALQIIVGSLGQNLQRIANETEKIFLHLQSKGEHKITKEIVYQFVQIDREFNVFELISAVGARDLRQSQLIVQRMTANTKEHSPFMMIGQLSAFFAKLALLKQQRANTDQAVVKALKISPFIARQYLAALKKYSYARLKQNLAFIQHADLSLKGVVTTNMSEQHIMQTLIFQLTAPDELVAA